METVGEKEKLRREPVKWSHMWALKSARKSKGERGAMLWEAACTCFFGCLRAGEALAPERGKFDKKAHLGWEDMQLEDAASPKWIRLRIKESKSDRLREGAFVTQTWRSARPGVHGCQEGRPRSILYGSRESGADQARLCV